MAVKAIASLWRCCMVAVFAIAWSAAVDPVQAAQPVAMVTDIEGESSVTGVEGSAILSLLAELAPGGSIDLAAGSRLVIVYYESGSEYAFAGPASIRIGVEAPEMVSGNSPEQRQVLPSDAGGEIIIRPVGMAQASLVMRGADENSDLRLINLVGTKTLEKRPVFHWRPLPGAGTYHFELTDDAGESLVEANVAAVELPLPETVTLEPDITYTWEVTTRTPDGALHSNWGDFTLASDDERALIERLRPTDDAPFSRRVVFAAVLQQMELRDAALAQWKALLAERGDDPRLRQLVGE